MIIKETKIYKYAELSEHAKEKARDWLRGANAGDNFFSEGITEDFCETLTALGFDATGRHGRDSIQWSGFSSQGDGAAFSGTWNASAYAPEKLLADRPPVWPEGSGGHACPANAELHRIAAELLACKDAGMTFARINASNRGFFMSLDSAEHDEPEEATNAEWDAIRALQADADERFIEAARDLAHAFYKALEAEYEYRNSDAAIVEDIEANEYEFTEEGRCA